MEAVLSQPNAVPASRARQYAALEGRDHAEDGRRGAEARLRNKARRRIERIEERIAAGELKTMASVRLLELWREDERYVDRVLVAESLEVKHLREQAEREAVAVQRLRSSRADLEEAIGELAEREQKLQASVGDLDELAGELRRRGIEVAS